MPIRPDECKVKCKGVFMEIKRKCQSIHLSKQPLALVLIQLRYLPINKIEERINYIQDQLREGYPLFKESHNVSMDVSRDNLDRIKVWEFDSIDGYEKICIDRYQVTYQTSDYTCFEKFYEEFEKIIRVLDGEISLFEKGFCVRYGLRYVDQIIPQGSDDSIDSYLHEGLQIQQPDVFENELKICSVSVAGAIELSEGRTGTMTINGMQSPQGIPLPPDLLVRAPKLKREIHQRQAMGLIDMDASFAISNERIEEGLIKKTFYELHDKLIDAFFNSVVSKEGIEKWK